MALATARDPYASVATLLAGGRPDDYTRPPSSYGAPGVVPQVNSAAAPAPSAVPATPQQNAVNALAQSAATPQPAAAPALPAPPSGTPVSVTNLVSGDRNTQKLKGYWDSVWQDIKGTPDEQDLTDYIKFVQTWPKYKGSYEAQRVAIANYARQLRMNRKNNEIDYGGLAKLGDEGRSIQNQVAARLAAMGASPGGGVAAGAYSDIAGKLDANAADYISQQNAEARRQKLALMLAQMQNDARLEEAAIAANQREQNDPGLFGDILGAVGNLVPVIGGVFSKKGGGSQAPQPSALY